MAFKSGPKALGTSDGVVFEMPAAQSGIVQLLLGNRNAGARSVSLKIYTQSSGITLTVVSALSWDGGKLEMIPGKFSLEAGDKIIMAASEADSLTVVPMIVSTAAVPVARGWEPEGEWSAGATYAANDIASKNGSSYISRGDGNIGNDPETSSEWWQDNARKGDPGPAVSPDRTVRVMDTSDTNPAASDYAAGAVIDGVTVVAGDLVLRNAPAHPERNGVWRVPATNAASRDDDYDTFDEHAGAIVSVQEGAANADTIWLCTSNTGGTLGTTAITWRQIGSLATESQAGLVELATDAEVRAGADTQRAVTPHAGASAYEPQAKARIVEYTDDQAGVLSDAGKIIELNKATALAYTIPPHADVAHEIGAYLNFVQTGDGRATIVAGSGVTINARNGLKSGGKGAMFSAYQSQQDVWVLNGDVTA